MNKDFTMRIYQDRDDGNFREFSYHDCAFPDLGNVEDRAQDWRWCFRYAYDVIEGNIVAGKWIRKACERFFNMMQDERFYFSARWAQDIVKFFHFIPITDGLDRGKPTRLFPWQIFLVVNVVAMKWSSGQECAHLRVFTQAYVQVGRKAGKSTLAGGLTLYFMLKSGYHRPRAYSVATKRDQAKELWKAARSMILNSARLNSVFEARANDILLPHMEGEFYALASESNSLDGKNPLMVNLDECHAVKDRNLYGVMVSAFGAQLEYLLLVITTAGFILDGLCTDLNKNGKMVLEGKATQDYYFYLIYEIDEKDEWNDPDVWVKANPAYPVQPSAKYMRDRCQEAEMSVTERMNFKTKHCNLFISGMDKWLDTEEFEANRDRNLNLTDMIGMDCYFGFDRALVADLVSLSMLFPTPDGGANFFTRSLLPRKTYKEATDYMREVYLKAIEEGSLELVEANVVDDDAVKDFIRKYNEMFAPEMIGFDPWHMRQVATDLEDEGLPMVMVSQGTGNMSEPAKKLEGLVKLGTFHYNDNMLEFAASNAIQKITDMNNVKIVRENPATDKIDPIIASIIALSCATLQELGTSYIEKGVLGEEEIPDDDPDYLEALRELRGED